MFKVNSGKSEAIRIDEYAKWISDEEFKEIKIQGEKPRTVWVAIIEVEISKLIGLRKIGLERHFILVFCAYTFILWHKLTGGLRRHWANKPLNTFPEALEAFRTAISFHFVSWLNQNRDVFVAYEASLGFVWT